MSCRGLVWLVQLPWEKWGKSGGWPMAKECVSNRIETNVDDSEVLSLKLKANKLWNIWTKWRADVQI